MINVGSISDQTLAGVITTATHGTGISYGVISTHVMELNLLLADGRRVSCSRHALPDLFSASLCGLGATGLILSIQLEVESAFRLEELQESLPFEETMQNFDELVHSAQHVRFWWYPATDTMRCSYFDRTQQVCCPSLIYLVLTLSSSQPKLPVRNRWYHTFLGHHVTQLLLFVARYFLFLNQWVARYSCWLVSARTLGVDDSPLIFNIDCKVWE
jgi:L-gulonolactone oxidase